MILNLIKEKIAKTFNIEESLFVYPPNNKLGDISLPLFSLAKEREESPNSLALKIKEGVLSSDVFIDIFERIEVVGPYLNFFINKKYLISETVKSVVDSPQNLFHNNFGAQKKVVFEYSNANTHKEIHIGHLRNIVLGDSLVKIYLANGFDAHPVSFINDFGINTAKTVWFYKNKKEKNIGLCYSQAVAELEKNSDINKEVGEIMSDIEKRHGENYKLWQETKDLSLLDFKKVYDILDVDFEKTYFESDLIDEGLEIVDDYLKRGIFKKSEGAIIADLEDYKLGVLPVIRSNGTALYPVADLALANRKFQDFSGLKKSFLVVDVRQSLHFKQLFKVLELAGYQNDFTHLSYDFVKLPEGMMSSRSGNAVSFEFLFEKIVERLSQESKKRHEDWSDDKILENSHKLAVAILKFEMLKISPNKIITFDIEEALRFEGFNALYIIYSLVRMKSILRKADFDFSFADLDRLLINLKEDLEKNICLNILKFSDVIVGAGKDNDPSEIAKYLFSFVQLFNDYYQRVNILKAEEETMRARLVLIKSCIVLIENAFSLLGIKTNIEEI
ncbi:MAG: arginine--tRNA ligase [Patescibacteria group bacterium]|nr:arginine--tRNA ligase [Patescibacteria group bacterium]